MFVLIVSTQKISYILVLFFLPRIRESKSVRACLCCWGLKGSHTVLSQAHPDHWMSVAAKTEKKELCSGLECQPHVSVQDVCCFPDRIWVRLVRRCSYLGISLIWDL